MNIKLFSTALVIGLLSVEANANISAQPTLDIKVIESKQALRQSSEDALRRYIDQRKKMQIESRLKAVDSKIAVREQQFVARTPL